MVEWIDINENPPKETKRGRFNTHLFKTAKYGIQIGVYRDGKPALNWICVFDCEITHYVILKEDDLIDLL